MKSHIIFTFKIFTILMVVLSSANCRAQDKSSVKPEFNYYIANDVQSSGNVIEFDLYLIDTNPASPLELASIQSGILVNPAIYNGGNITASIVAGSSELISPQQPKGITFSQNSNILKIAARMIKLDEKGNLADIHGTIISAVNPGTRVCRIKLTNSVSFANAPANLSFCFERSPYSTVVTEYNSGTNTRIICNASNCFSKATNSPLK
jgi:hypothetical protein